MITSEASLYVYLQRQDTGEWVTVGRLTVDVQRSKGIFLFAPSYIDAGHPWVIDPVNLVPMVGGKEYDAPRYGGIPDVMRDAGPDAWGKVLIGRENQLPDYAHEIHYLRHSGNEDRWGALAFGSSKKPSLAHLSSPRIETLADLVAELALMCSHQPARSEKLRRKLLRTASMGGARPKVTVRDRETYWIAKPTVPTDTFNVALAEHATMQWAKACGLHVAETRLVSDAARSTVLVERFDRQGSQRKMTLSGASLLSTEYPAAGNATANNQLKWSYPLLAQALRRIGVPVQDLQELYCRMVFNCLAGNDDDHPRNHAAVWKESEQRWRLSPAFDIVPNILISPTMLSMQLCNGSRTITRQTALEDWKHFGFAAQENAAAMLDGLIAEATATFAIAEAIFAQNNAPDLELNMHEHLQASSGWLMG